MVVKLLCPFAMLICENRNFKRTVGNGDGLRGLGVGADGINVQRNSVRGADVQFNGCDYA